MSVSKGCITNLLFAIERPNSLFHDLLLPKLTCRVSFSDSFCASFASGENCLYRNNHINNFVCVLILVNLDVLGLLVDLLLGDLLLGDGSISLRDLLDESGTSPLRLVDKIDVVFRFTALLPCDRRAAPLPCKKLSVCLQLFPLSTFVLTLVCVLWSFVVGRLRGGLRRASHGLPCRAPVHRGCRCRDPQVGHRVQSDSVANRQPFLCGCWCAWSRDIICSLRSHSTCLQGCVNNWL